MRYEFKTKGTCAQKINFDIDGNIGCVLVHNMPTTVRPLVWGSNNNKSCFKEDIIEILKEEKAPKITTIKKESQLKNSTERVNEVEELTKQGNDSYI